MPQIKYTLTDKLSLYVASLLTKIITSSDATSDESTSVTKHYFWRCIELDAYLV